MGGDSLVDCEGGEIKYDAAKVIEVFVGLNTQDINVAIERNRDLHQRQVEKVRAPPVCIASKVRYQEEGPWTLAKSGTGDSMNFLTRSACEAVPPHKSTWTIGVHEMRDPTLIR